MRMTLAQARKAFPTAHIPKSARLPRAKSRGEEMFALLCQTEALPAPTREYAFDPTRRWRFDFAWPTLKVAVEVEGLRKRFIDGVPYALGRHCTFKGFADDCVKYAHAAILGWYVLRFTPSLIRSGMAIELTRRMLVQAEQL